MGSVPWRASSRSSLRLKAEPTEADDHDHDADVDDVSAVAAGIAAGKKQDGGEEVAAGLFGDDGGAAQEFGEDGGEDGGGEREADQRVEVAGVECAVLPGR